MDFEVVHFPIHSLVITEKEVHLWCASLQSFSVMTKTLMALLSKDEITRADRFRSTANRDFFTIGRGLLRSILSSYTGVQPQSIEFYYNEFGKPFLLLKSDQTPLAFNLSHSEDLAVYGVSYIKRIGVDIERIRRNLEYKELAQQFFSETEYKAFELLPEESKCDAFFRCWTRKESYVKALGKGMSIPLNQFDVSLAPYECTELIHTKVERETSVGWHIYSLESIVNYTIALAVEAKNIKLKIWCLKPPY